jgi:hypothetical protein
VRRENYEVIHGADWVDAQTCSFCDGPGWAAQWDGDGGAAVRVCMPCASHVMPKLFADAVPGRAFASSLRHFASVARDIWRRGQRAG